MKSLTSICALAAVALSGTLASATDLPEGYTKVRGITSHGTEYLLPEITPTTQLGVEMSFNSGTGSEKVFFGAKYANYAYLFMHRTSFVWYGANDLLATFAENADCSICIDPTASPNTTLTVGGVATTYSLSLPATTALGIFACGDGASKSAFTLYSFKASFSGTLYADLVPCVRDSDDEVGVYDVVREKFYGNAGTGAFDVVQEESGEETDWGVMTGSWEHLVTGEGDVVIFTGNGSWTPKKNTTVLRYLVVGGGGSGGWTIGGGGGGGDVVASSDTVVVAAGTKCQAVVGGGGGNNGVAAGYTTQNKQWPAGVAGSNSSLVMGGTSVVATGGGAGGGWNATSGGSGACGGGGTATANTGSAGTAGGAGGSGCTSSGGGGGGKASDGGTGAISGGGAGGQGVVSDITGTNVMYGAGGGGGASTGTAAGTGVTAGGTGAAFGGDAVAGTGCGGGGGGYEISTLTGYRGGNGGRGTVILCLQREGSPYVTIDALDGVTTSGATVHWRLRDLSGCSAATVSLERSGDADFSTTVTTNLGSFTAVSGNVTNTVALTEIGAGLRHWIRLVAVGEYDGSVVTARSAAVTFDTQSSADTPLYVGAIRTGRYSAAVPYVLTTGGTLSYVLDGETVSCGAVAAGPGTLLLTNFLNATAHSISLRLSLSDWTLTTPAVAFATSSASLRISILGDSYSTYSGATGCENPFYPRNSYDVTEEASWWRLTIAGLGGTLGTDRAYGGSWMSDLDQSYGFGIRAQALGDSDLIFVFGGMNDDWNGVTAETLAANGGKVLNYVRGNWPDAEKYVILHVLNPAVSSGSGNPGLAARTRETLRGEATRLGYGVIDLDDDGVTLAEMQASGQDHPNAAIMARFANRVLSVVRQADLDRLTAPTNATCAVATTSDPAASFTQDGPVTTLRFTTAGTFSLIPNERLVLVRARLVGGSGAEGWCTTNAQAGAAGAVSDVTPASAVLSAGTSYAFTVGAGGTSAASAAWGSTTSSDWQDGGAGGATTFPSFGLSAAGGAGGAADVTEKGYAGYPGKAGSLELQVASCTDGFVATLSVTSMTDRVIVSAKLYHADASKGAVKVSCGLRLKSEGPAATIPLETLSDSAAAGDAWCLTNRDVIAGKTYLVRLHLAGSDGSAAERQTEVTVVDLAESGSGRGEVTFDGTYESLTTENGRFAYRFTSSGTLTVVQPVTLDRLLLVGGGGAGGWTIGGGGGGGGVVACQGEWTLPAGAYAVTVGAGGDPRISAGSWVNGGDGGASSFVGGELSWTALGGGGGGAYDGSTALTQSGVGSGGGGASTSYDTIPAAGTPGKGTDGQGHDGGLTGMAADKSYKTPGGGGGAGRAGFNGTDAAAGAGGEGVTNDITGVACVYGSGGGGGGGNVALTPGAGGTNAGRGARMDPATSDDLAVAGTDGFGGGGGGGAFATSLSGNYKSGIYGAAGGSGCVILGGRLVAELRVTSAELTDRYRRLNVQLTRVTTGAAEDVDVYWTSGRYTSDLTGWTKIAAAGTFESASSTLSLRVTLGHGAKYVVFASGANRTTAVVLRELSTWHAPGTAVRVD